MDTVIVTVPGGVTVAKKKVAAYPKEFRDAAVEEVRVSGRSIASVAQGVGIHESTLRGWVMAAAGKDPVDESTPLNVNERVRLRELEKENQRLRAENVFLGKVSAYFAQNRP